MSEEMKIYIGIPTRGNDISSGLMGFITRFISKCEKGSTGLLLAKSSVSAALAVEELWRMLYERLGTFDYYLQIDADVEPPDNAIESMVSRDKDIVVAPIWHYDDASRDIHMNIHFHHLRERFYGVKPGGYEKIYASSLGCCLMKHKVIETFYNKKESPIKWSDLLGSYTGEDIHNDNVFFAKASKLGLEAWVDWDVRNVIHHRKVDLCSEVLNRFVEHVTGQGKEEKIAIHD